MTRRGILMAGGSGSRLYPITQVVSKQLLPVYDKPMIYYSLSTLMSSGIRDILIISTRRDTPRFHTLLGDGSQWGISLHYAAQPSPDGTAQAFIIGRDFIAGNTSALVLGDNIFYGANLSALLTDASRDAGGATVFAYQVKDSERYGVIEFDADLKAVSLQEKPCVPRSPYAATGLYFYDDQVCDIAKTIRPSTRSEYEITDINAHYLAIGKLNVRLMGADCAWLDAGTHDSLLEASTFVATLQKRDHVVVGCPEEIAFKKGWISVEQLCALVLPIQNSAYGQYLINFCQMS